MPAAVIAVVDAVLVLAFAATGRSSHDEDLDVVGILATAWPFLVGAAVGWIVVYAVRRRVPAAWQDGVIVWACCLVAGMLLRRVSGAGTAVSFIIVAAIVLATLLVGWRAIAAAVDRRRS